MGGQRAIEAVAENWMDSRTEVRHRRYRLTHSIVNIIIILFLIRVCEGRSSTKDDEDGFQNHRVCDIDLKLLICLNTRRVPRNRVSNALRDV